MTEQTVCKTIGIRLKLTIDQEKEMSSLFEAFRTGINWSLSQIEKRYQSFLSNYYEMPEDKRYVGLCAACNTDKLLMYIYGNGRAYCKSCATKSFSEYTIRKEVYGVGDRKVEEDLSDVVSIANRTHYTMLFQQAYAMWKSYNTWRDKRKREKKLLESHLASYPDQVLLKAAMLIEQKASDSKLTNPKLTWKTAKALATKDVYKDFSEKEQDEISKLHDMLMDLRRLNRPVHFPELKECRTVMMNKSFVEWKNSLLYLTLWSKKKQQVSFYGKTYLDQFINSAAQKTIHQLIEESEAYCNLNKKGDQYYLMYPLKLKVKQPVDIAQCDSFVFMSSPAKTAIFGYDGDGVLNSVKWFPTGKLVFAKRNFKEKRREIGRRRSQDEKMRKIRRRKKKISKRSDIERRFVSTFNHQLTRKMIDYVTEQSENPKIIIWDVGNGMTQNFGHILNSLKNLWPAVQQQDYLKHKAMQLSIPIIEMPYNKCNNLVCSSCGKKQMNGKKPAKTITQIIKGIRNFKCQNCGYEVNMLINQGNIIANL